MRDETLDVRVGRLLVEGKTEVRELESDVRPQALGGEPVEDPLVLCDGGGGTLRVGNRLAEERRVRVQPGPIQSSKDGHALVERRAGDEAGSAEPHPVALHEPR